jgi:uncharacterized membrane protein
MSTTNIMMLCGAMWLGCGAEAGPVDVTTTPESAAAPAVPTPPAPAMPGASDGYPCAVRVVLETYCAGCHAGNRYYAPQFTEPAIFRLSWLGAGSLGAEAVARMADPVKPMPPANIQIRPQPAERDVFASWVAAGMPSGDCGWLVPPP